MREENETKLGLTAEEVEENRETEFGLSGLFRGVGDAECDPIALAHSKEGLLMQEYMAVMGLGEDTDESRDYWANYGKGLRKELHGDPANVHSKWASYLPLAAEQDAARRFPLIFCLHGAHNPIHLAESYGVMQLAAREECIVIAPENENLDNILALLDYAKAHYPVDESRVYSIGYSFGGFMTARNTLARPDLFAAAGMGGMLFAGDVIAHELDGQFYPEYRLTEKMLQRAEQLEMPAAMFMGEHEMLHLEPLWREPTPMIRDGVIPLAAEDKHRAFNNWRRVAGCEPCDFDRPVAFYQEHSDPVVKSVGAVFERNEVRMYNERRYFIGDSVKADGECLFRVISCEGMAHWPTTVFADLVWEHISRFARDTKTGKLIRLK